jgi:uncharacterized protein YwgA
MKPLQRATVLLTLLDRLRAHGSWCGETHLQKSTFFLQELLRVPLDFNFIFYKHGPYSFDLADEVTALRADQLLTLQLRDPYGPSLLPSAGAESVMSRFPVTRQRYQEAIEFVASHFGRKNVADLEQLATALYVTLDEKERMPSIEERARRVHALKKHVSMEEARAALLAVDGMIGELASMPGEWAAQPATFHSNRDSAK